MSYSKLTLEAQFGGVQAEKFEFKVRQIFLILLNPVYLHPPWQGVTLPLKNLEF